MQASFDPMTIRRFGLILGAASLFGASGCTGGGSPTAERTVPVSFTGGFAIGANDYGRPVPLYAAMLGVTPTVFRAAFAGVRPDGAHAPTGAQQQANKAALMSVLAAYDVTNDRLDEVANYYRFDSSRGQTWPQRSAHAEAVVSGGRVIAIRILDAGVGYTQAPTATVPGYPNATLTASVAFTSSFATNGHVSAVTIAG